jgi:hypothetical protein
LRVAGNDAQLDPIRCWTLAALFTDPSLGGLALEIEERATEWQEADASESDYSQADYTFRVRYVTARGDLTRAA